MSESVRITCLIENTANHDDLKSEHGLAFLVEIGGECLLFDTGQTDALLLNAKSLNVGLPSVRHIVLSHGHYDHTGGLMPVVRQCRGGGTLFAEPRAFGPHFSAKAGVARDIGVQHCTPDTIRQEGWQITWTADFTAVLPGVSATGPVPRRNAIEDPGGPFFLDGKGTQPDLIMDDQALAISTSRGLIILLGCCHAGVMNTLSYIREFTHNLPIQAVIGGMHLKQASAERVAATIAHLTEHGIRCIAPAHCTGATATAEFQKAFQHSFRVCQAGSRFEFPL
jgi:7,8-dihydropterin-6-yl-methyl-4-(beta-D-ribofuranosyl)aminobenzene 5'-phosphate synthase